MKVEKVTLECTKCGKSWTTWSDQVEASKAEHEKEVHGDPVADAVKAERERCIKVAKQEYAYWKQFDNEANADNAETIMGAMGSCANILVRIIDPKQPPTGTQDAAGKS